MRLPAAREGNSLRIVQRELEFSFFMMRRTTSRWGVHHLLYAAEPWGVISGSVTQQVALGPERSAALSFVRQGREYFSAAQRADTLETRPLLYYYAFLNFAKALAMCRGRTNLVGRVTHGLGVAGSKGHTPQLAELRVERTGGRGTSALDELHQALEGGPVPTANLPVRELIAQSVIAHRMWCEAANRRERFLGVKQVSLRHNATAKAIWASVRVPTETMQVQRRPVSVTARDGHLAPSFRPVADRAAESQELRAFEQVIPTTYRGRAADEVMSVVSLLKPILWQTITNTPPHRRFYLYLSPRGEQRHPQWLSIYATFFWLGSMTRYQPVELLSLLDGTYGSFFREFLETQPTQLLYILTSEFKLQDVARAAVV